MLIHHRLSIFPHRIRISAAIKDMEEKEGKRKQGRSRIGERFDNGERKRERKGKGKRERKDGDGVG